MQSPTFIQSDDMCVRLDKIMPPKSGIITTQKTVDKSRRVCRRHKNPAYAGFFADPQSMNMLMTGTC
jgi:hypothetical protein